MMYKTATEITFKGYKEGDITILPRVYSRDNPAVLFEKYSDKPMFLTNLYKGYGNYGGEAILFWKDIKSIREVRIKCKYY